MGAFIVFGEKMPSADSMPFGPGGSEFGLVVDQHAPDVIQALGVGSMVHLSRTRGGTTRAVWVNPAAVLYVTEHEVMVSRSSEDEMPPEHEHEPVAESSPEPMAAPALEAAPVAEHA